MRTGLGRSGHLRLIGRDVQHAALEHGGVGVLAVGTEEPAVGQTLGHVVLKQVLVGQTRHVELDDRIDGLRLGRHQLTQNLVHRLVVVGLLGSRTTRLEDVEILLRGGAGEVEGRLVVGSERIGRRVDDAQRRLDVLVVVLGVPLRIEERLAEHILLGHGGILHHHQADRVTHVLVRGYLFVELLGRHTLSRHCGDSRRNRESKKLHVTNSLSY